jgi:hypothetical protein
MRLSVTTVEAFRLWRDTGDWMDLADLEATIKRTTVPSEKMLRGIAFHSVLENPIPCRECPMGDHQYRVKARDDGRDFVFAGIGTDRVLDLWPNGAREVKTTCDIDGITLVGVADLLRGNLVGEAKCTEKIDVENYFDSFQWRAVLKLFNAAAAWYVLAQGRDVGGRFIAIDHELPMTMYRYRGLDDDVRRLTLECAEFVRQRKLEEFVQDIREAA